MPLFPNSAFRIGENGERITATKVTTDSKEIIFLHDRKRFTLDDLRGNVKLREVLSGEQIDLISYERCAIATKWYIIADINELFYPDEELVKGTRLLIPDTEDLKTL